MNDEIMLIIGDDGFAEEYKTDFDITIHCENKEDQEQARRMIMERRWIPVSDRLPEKEGDYITTTMYNEVYCDYWNGEYFNRTETVIAWMDLPAPYEPGRKQNG